MVKKYAPRRDERARDLFECADRAAERVNNLSDEESARHWRELGYDYCRVNRHTQETNEGQARNLTKYEHIKYKG